MIKRLFWLAAAVLLSLGLTACGGSSDPADAPEMSISGPALLVFFSDN